MPLDHPNAPRLLAGIIHRKADVFKGKHGKYLYKKDLYHHYYKFRQNRTFIDWAKYYNVEHMTDWSHNSQHGQVVNSQSQMYGINNISGISSSPQSQHGMMAGTSHMSMNPIMDLQAPHHPGVMNSDTLQMVFFCNLCESRITYMHYLWSTTNPSN